MASVNMRFAEVTKSSTPEVLKRLLGAEYLVPVVLDSTAFTSGVCAAGTAIDKDGKVAKTDGTTGLSNAVGILLNDVYVENPNGSLVKAFAVINSANTTATAADKTALPLLMFE